MLPAYNANPSFRLCKLFLVRLTLERITTISTLHRVHKVSKERTCHTAGSPDNPRSLQQQAGGHQPLPAWPPYAHSSAEAKCSGHLQCWHEGGASEICLRLHFLGPGREHSVCLIMATGFVTSLEAKPPSSPSLANTPLPWCTAGVCASGLECGTSEGIAE